MRNLRGIYDNLSTKLEEDQALLTIVGGIGGVVGALLLDRFGPDSELSTLTVTVSQARATLLSALALVFSGLSIVLALTALTTGNMASKFSPRFLRMKLRHSRNKWVLGVFVLTASFIITSQILLRNSDGDSLAPPAMLIANTVLLVLTGVVIIVYIDGTLHSLRVDRAVRWIIREIDRTARRHEHELRHDTVFPEVAVTPRAGSVDLVAQESGYVVSVDTDRLDELATEHDLEIVIEAGPGRPVVLGERIGWLSAPSQLDDRNLVHILDCVGVAHDRNPDVDTGYTIHVLVDIGLMALSPAVNDPQTGVQCAEALTQVFAGLAEREIGVRTRLRADGSPRVVVIEDTIGDWLDGAGRQLLLYGATDRSVTAALLRLGQQGERVSRFARDRRLATAFAADVDSERASGAASQGAEW